MEYTNLLTLLNKTVMERDEGLLDIYCDVEEMLKDT